MLKYILNLWEQVKRNKSTEKLPVIIPIVFYHGTSSWRIGLKLSDLIDTDDKELLKYIPDYEYILTDLSRYKDEELSENLKLFIGLILMKHIFDNLDNLEAVFNCVEKFLKIISSFLMEQNFYLYG